MNYEILNPSFAEIDRVRMGNEVYIRCSTSSLPDYDFLETGFKYFPNKSGFSDFNPLDFLHSSDKERIGTNIGSVEKYLVTLFPGVTFAPEVGNNTKYFSTYQSKENEVFCIIVPEGYREVLLDDRGVTAIKVMFDTNEAEKSKILYMVTSYSSDSPVILNLSYISYQIDKNPNSKMSDYVLRNDSDVRVRGLEKNSVDLIFSSLSGSLIGTRRIENRPIYDLLVSGGMEGWYSEVVYSLGDKVMIGNQEYESLIPDNKGNYPQYSKYWAIHES